MKILSQSLVKIIIYITSIVLLIYLLLMSVLMFYLTYKISQVLSPVPTFTEILQKNTSSGLRQAFLLNLNTLLVLAIKLLIGFFSILCGLVGFIKKKKWAIFILSIYSTFFILSNRNANTIEVILEINAILLMGFVTYWYTNFQIKEN